MKPSKDAIRINRALMALRAAIGTPRENLAHEYLRIVVERVKAKAEKP